MSLDRRLKLSLLLNRLIGSKVKLLSSNRFPMKYPIISYRIFPLGDSALTVDFGSVIDEMINQQVIARFRQLQQHPVPGMIEVVPAYSSVTIYYNVLTVKKYTPSGESAFERMKQEVEARLKDEPDMSESNLRLLRIPVCYDTDFATDIEFVARIKNISVAELIQIHTRRIYKVYMLGFLPGFAYMGEVDNRIAVPRKKQPQTILPGSVGIAGKQTGIYPMASPGGWQIIGRSPLNFFTAEENKPTLLQAGDNVQFFTIDKNEFENY